MTSPERRMAVLGAGEMGGTLVRALLEAGELSADQVVATVGHPALLKDDITTPAGCTIAGLLELEAGGLRLALIKAVMQSRPPRRRAGGGRGVSGTVQRKRSSSIPPGAR